MLSNRVRFLEKGREKLKNQVRELRAELARTKSEERKREERNLTLTLSATLILSPTSSSLSPWFCHRRHVSGALPAPWRYSCGFFVFRCLLRPGIRAVCGCSSWDIISSRGRRRRRRTGCGLRIIRFRSERRSAW